MAEVIRLDTQLSSRIDRRCPLEFHDKNGLFLPAANSQIQSRLNYLLIYTDHYDMLNNIKKTKVMPFNIN